MDCGNGLVQPGKACDDGTAADPNPGTAGNGVCGDKCSATCQLHWCGDGILDAGEQCDDGCGNGEAGSGCSATCTISGPSCPEGCGPGTCVFASGGLSSLCVCPTGYVGPTCDCNVPSYFLETDHPPVLDVSRSGFLPGDVNLLTLFVNVSAKYYNTQIVFKNQQNASCDYPATGGVNYWQATYNPFPACSWSLRGRIPWGVAWWECISIRTVTPGWITFTGEMDVSMTEPLGAIRGVPLTRTMTDPLLFQLLFPTQIDVDPSLGVSIYSPFLTEAAIVGQSFATNAAPPGGTGSVRLYTNTQWPFMLTAPISAQSNIVALPTTVAGPEATAICPNDGTSPCQQWFDFTTVPAIGQCTLDAMYTFNFTVECQPGMAAAGTCPLSGYSATRGSLEYVLQSSNFCTQVLSTVGLTGSMTPYDSSAYTTPKYDYTLGETAYFLARSASTQISIVNTSFAQITASPPSGPGVVLYDITLGGNTALGNAASLVVTDGWAGDGKPNTDATFSVLYAAGIFPIPADSDVAWSFAVTLDVTFYNTGPEPAAYGPHILTTTRTQMVAAEQPSPRQRASSPSWSPRQSASSPSSSLRQGVRGLATRLGSARDRRSATSKARTDKGAAIAKASRGRLDDEAQSEFRFASQEALTQFWLYDAPDPTSPTSGQSLQAQCDVVLTAAPPSTSAASSTTVASAAVAFAAALFTIVAV